MDAYGWLLNSYSGFLEKILIPFKQPKTKKDNYRVLNNYLEHLTSMFMHFEFLAIGLFCRPL